ncbi:MAG: phosphatidylglycerol lysyltransferase domain-containing protein [Dysgonamonadaceae bacterium]|jgi:hypothetical protein|nr:phosphatidylglycerol lysyltransferase domain-containing protein [Dysgonamonadaceae bacterium]
MLNFRPITIDDKETVQPFFDKSIFGNCDFSFSNILSWKHLYNTAFTVEDGFLYIRFQSPDDSSCYLFPLGDGDLKKALEQIKQDAQERNNPFMLCAITQAMFNRIENVMPGLFVYETERNWYEYIYSAGDLISLAGRKYQAKRNHINKFKRTYSWEYLPITKDIIPDCLNLYERWNIENRGYNSERSLREEKIATQKAFDNYERLGLTGGALRINGEILAYSYGQPLGKDTFGIHAEKCLYEIDGGFAMINQQFAEHNCAGYLYINREEDLGIDTLRKAKMSYHPVMLLEKGRVMRKTEN